MKKGSHTDYEAIIKRLFEPPANEWPKKIIGTEGIEYLARVTVDPSRIADLRAIGPRLFVWNFKKPGRTELRICHCRDARRIEIAKPGFLGDSIAVVRLSSGDSMLINRSARYYMQLSGDISFPEEEIPEVHYSIESGKVKQIQGRKCKRIDIRVTAPMQLEIVLWVTSDSDLSSFKKDVVETLFDLGPIPGAAGSLVRDIAETGFPLKGEVYLPEGDARSDAGPVSRFTIKDIHLGEVESENFVVPDGYRNLRKRSKKDARTHTIKSNRVRTRDRISRRPIGGRSEQVSRNADTPLWQVGPQAEAGDIAPRCLPATYGALVADQLRQTLLDHVRTIINGISVRLSGFHGANGYVWIDWMEQFRNTAAEFPEGDALYCLLRDEDTGEGVLDILAREQVRGILTNGEVPPFRPDANVESAVNDVLNDTSIPPEERFEALDPAVQDTLRDFFVESRVGFFQLTYPTESQQTILEELVEIKLERIRFDLAINQTPILESLELNNNRIEAVIHLPAASFTAEIKRKPTRRYYWLLAFGVVAAALANPFGGAFYFSLAAVATWLFVYDTGDITATVDNLELRLPAHYAQGFPAGLLIPRIDELTIEGDLEIDIDSDIPDLAHDLIDWVYAEVIEHFLGVLEGFGDGLEQMLNDWLANQRFLQFPPQTRQFPVLYRTFSTAGAERDHFFVEAELQTHQIGIPSFSSTQIDSRDLPTRIAQFHRNINSAGFNYFNFIFSQNYLNEHLHHLWTTGAFTYGATPVEVDDFAVALQNACAACPPIRRGSITVAPAVPPRLVLLPGGRAINGPYAEIHFDDVRVCLRSEHSIAEFQLTARSVAQIGFFGVERPDDAQPQLSITRLTRFFDIYVDLARLTLSPAPSLGVVNNNAGLGALNVTMLDSLRPAFRALLRTSLRRRSDLVVPREVDAPPHEQTYLLGDGAAGYLEVQLVVERGNLHALWYAFGTLVSMLNTNESWIRQPGANNCQFGRFLRGG